MSLTRPDASQIARKSATMPTLDFLPRDRGPYIIAHRGFVNQGPQNTLAAFSKALAR